MILIVTKLIPILINSFTATKKLVIHYIDFNIKMVFLSGVEDKFLHVWLSCHRIKESELSLSSGGHGKGSHKCKYIGNKSLALRIKNDYSDFVACGSDFENYFNRSVIEFKQNDIKYQYTTKIKNVKKNPVFIYKSQKAYRLRPNN